MKKLFALKLIAVLVMSGAVQSCEKDEPVDTKSYVVIHFLRSFNTCNKAKAICIRPDEMNKTIAEQQLFGLDEGITAPQVQSNGAILMDMEIPYENFSEEAKKLFFEADSMIIDEDFVLSEATMKLAYKNSEKSYNGERQEVVQGLHVIKREGSGSPANRKPKLTIVIEKGKITITLTW